MKIKLLISGLTLLISLNIFSQENTNQLTMENTINQKPILGLRTVSYKVADITKAKEWYAKAFQTEPYFDEPFYVGLNIGGYELGLQPDENPPTEKAESVVAFWGVSDIEKEYNRFLESGAVEHEKPNNVGGEIVVATVKDPWGNIIGLIYNPEFRIEKQ
jgi:predicted enzyme related to lactoylglutathione lyase